MLKNLPMILLVLVIAYVVYASGILQRVQKTVTQAVMQKKAPAEHSVEGKKDIESDLQMNMQSNIQSDVPNQSAGGMDMGMYDVPNEMAFGTTAEAERRITNDGVRKEYHHNPFPWAECGCGVGCDKCDKHGVPDPTPGQTHVCKNGFPSKRVVDMYGGHFQLNHICAPGVADSCSGEPATLGRWWCRKGCAGAESVGLNVRSACTRCA